jgi:repressor LexA
VLNTSHLTQRQKQIYEFIRETIESRGYPPTVREIGKAFNIESPNGVMCHLNALVKKGMITRKGQEARAMQLTDYRRPSTIAELPLLGKVAAGTPIPAVEEVGERLNLADLLIRPDHIALRVRGRSMIEDHIDDGDYVVIRKQETAENGERVVAMVDDEVTLKRFYQEKNRIVLHPSNGDMEPIVVDKDSDTRIIGLLVGVVRKC